MSAKYFKCNMHFERVEMAIVHVQSAKTGIHSEINEGDFDDANISKMRGQFSMLLMSCGKSIVKKNRPFKAN